MAFGLFIIPLFSIIGCMGNALSIRVLVHHRMRSPTNMLLAALALSDMLVLLHALYFSFLKFYIMVDPETGQRLRTRTFPVMGPYTSVVTARITTGLTTVLSIERLVAVYFPMKAKVMCSRFTTGLCIAFIFIVTTLAFVPKAIKYHAVLVRADADAALPHNISNISHATSSGGDIEDVNPNGIASSTTTATYQIGSLLDSDNNDLGYNHYQLGQIDNSPNDNRTQLEKMLILNRSPTSGGVRLRMELTELGRDKHFFLVYGNILNVLFRLMPIVILILVNTLIAHTINKTWSFRRSASVSVSNCAQNGSVGDNRNINRGRGRCIHNNNMGNDSHEQLRITIMLLVVSLVFLLCILPGAIHSIMSQIYTQYSRFGSQSNINAIFGNVTYFLETFNSSINFVIYMAYSSKFNRTYRQIFGCSHQQRLSTTGTSKEAGGPSSRSIMRFPLHHSCSSNSTFSCHREQYQLKRLIQNFRKSSSCEDDSMHNGSPNVTLMMTPSAIVERSSHNSDGQQPCRALHRQSCSSCASLTRLANKRQSFGSRHSSLYSHSENSNNSNVMGNSGRYTS